MKKNVKVIVTILIALILILLVAVFVATKQQPEEISVSGKEELYDKVEKYLIAQEKPKYVVKEKDDEPNYNISDFQVFTDIAKLGITEKGDETYVYVWALVESYYVQDNTLITNSGYSVPYKFIIKNNEIVDYKIPDDGTEYLKSIKRIFPENIRKMFTNDLTDNDKIRTQVQEHYSYLYK